MSISLNKIYRECKYTRKIWSKRINAKTNTIVDIISVEIYLSNIYINYY